MNIGLVDYTKPIAPAAYHCHVCKRHGCKLWREYNTFANLTELTCFHCTKEREGEWLVALGADQIGFRVAAVPTMEGNAFWGYTSVPQDGCKWWRSLPDTVPLHA